MTSNQLNASMFDMKGLSVNRITNENTNAHNQCKLSENKNTNSFTNALSVTDTCSDSEEDFDRTTKKLGVHSWAFNYEDVSSKTLMLV